MISSTLRSTALAILAALHFQISNADVELARLKQGGSPITISDYDRVRGQLVGYQKAFERLLAQKHGQRLLTPDDIRQGLMFAELCKEEALTSEQK